jgi:hypothetical protein
VVSFVYLSAECLFNEFYGINCRPKFDTKLLDRFFHRRRQVSPPVNNLRHRFLDGSQHVLYGNVTIGSRHGAVACLSRKQNSVPEWGRQLSKAERSGLFLPSAFSHSYAAVLAATPERRKASKSLFIVSAFVVGMPCGKFLYVFSVPFFTSLADNGAESA